MTFPAVQAGADPAAAAQREGCDTLLAHLLLDAGDAAGVEALLRDRTHRCLAKQVRRHARRYVCVTLGVSCVSHTAGVEELRLDQTHRCLPKHVWRYARCYVRFRLGSAGALLRMCHTRCRYCNTRVALASRWCRR